ncbi:MAG: hypothetical protein LR008_01075 [Candidatus Pacebacteria bacterium]|nr:hypothetical protein [Candidatus Paceibacterota bacterium]
MTALDEVLKAEQEAETGIETAKAEAAASVTAAREEKSLRLESEGKKLDEAGKAALKEYEKHVADMTGKIDVETTDNVTAVKKKFADSKEEVLKVIKQNFK